MPVPTLHRACLSRVLLLALLVCIQASNGLAQAATQEWQARAVLKHPDLRVPNSALNQQFVAAVAARRQSNPGFFTDPRWPLLLADELAPPPAVASPPPIPSPDPVSSPSVASAPLTAEYDAGTLPAGLGLTSAKFRWWSPAETQVVGVLVLLEGRGGDSRPMVKQAEWQALAARTHFALMGAHLVNPPDDLYTFQGDPNGQISDLLDKAAKTLLDKTGQKLKDPPLAFWGHSAGGNITQQYMSRHANRVAGAVLMRATGGPGGLAPGKDEVPTLICVGGKDKPDWVKAALANYEAGHTTRATWTLALNASEGHEVGRTQALAVTYLLAAIERRLPSAHSTGSNLDPGPAGPLKRLDKQAGWLGDPNTFEVAEYSKYPGKKQDAVWLLDETTARAWQTYQRPL